MSESMKRTVQAYVKGYANSIQAKDPKLTSAFLTEDCRRFIGPSSFLLSMGMPQQLVDAGSDNQTYEAHFARQLPAIRSTSTKVHEESYDSQGMKATVHLTHEIHVIDTEKPFFVENLILFHFNADGSKIWKILEFTDTDESKRYMGRVGEVLGATS